MDDKLLLRFYHLAYELSPRRGKRQQFSDTLIATLYQWSVQCNKPMYWVCDPAHAPPFLRDRPLPSVSQFSRRVRGTGVQQLRDAILLRLKPPPADTAVGCWMLDAKPLVISPYSKDEQAKFGWAYNGLARGYKVFALCNRDQHVLAWRVYAMNHAEPVAAKELMPAIDRPGYLLGDSIYDTNDLHQLAAERGLQLVAPRKEPGGPIGERARHPHRLHAIDMLECHVNTFGPALYAWRTNIERAFSRMTCSSVGMDHLPGWVRTLPRVQRWVQAKLTLYAMQN